MPHMTNRLLKIVLLAALAYFEAFPQSFPFTTYTTTDGLAQSAVSCFFQDSRGHMWFGTWGGISRYDGRTFWSYKNSAFHVTSICEDGRDTLWIGTTSGLARLAFGDSTVRWVKTRDGSLPSDYVLTLLKDDDGNMWVGTDRGLVIYTPSGRSVSFGTEQGLQDQYIPVLRKDSTGAILIGSAGGILQCAMKNDELINVRALLKGTSAPQMIELRNGDILAGSSRDRSVIRYHDGVWTLVFSCEPLGPAVQVRSLGEDEQGNLWIGTTDGLVVVEAGHAVRLPRDQRLPNQYIGAIFRDREDLLWFGTEGGAFKLVSTPFRSYNYSTGLRSDHVIGIFLDGERNCWLGTYNGAAMLEPGGRTTSFGLHDGLPHLAVHSFAQGLHGSVWIGSWNGLVVYERGHLKPGPNSALRDVPVIRLLPDRQGTLWCASRRKIVNLTPGGKVLLTLDADKGIPDADVSAVFIDAENTLWFGTDSRGGGFYRDGKIVLLGEPEGLPHPWVMSISQDKHGAIWFATQRGAVFWSGNRFEPMRTAEEDLHDGIVTFVVRDSLRNMWFGTQRGIYEWDDSVVVHLGTDNGLVADPTRCGYVDTEGNLWIGTVGGVSRLEMRTFRKKQDPPPVHIEGLAPDGQPHPSLRTSFSYSENTLTAHFNSLSFRDERRTEFQWMLEGFDETWQAPHTDRYVRYTHLPWGTYELLVRARNGRTPWSDAARLAFVIHPPFWGTWWFVALSVLAVAGVLLSIHSRRVRSLEKEALAEQRFSRRLLDLQEHERKRLAGELHDSLVQNLIVAKNRSLLGIKNADDPGRVATELTNISDALTTAIHEVREIAHNLRPYQLDRLGLTQALRSLTADLSASSTTAFTADIDDIDSLMTPDSSTLVYRIVQESLNNILTHSTASAASIAVRRTSRGIDITVRDDGRGFPIGSLDATPDLWLRPQRDRSARPDAERDLGDRLDDRCRHNHPCQHP